MPVPVSKQNLGLYINGATKKVDNRDRVLFDDFLLQRCLLAVFLRRSTSTYTPWSKDKQLAVNGDTQKQIKIK